MHPDNRVISLTGVCDQPARPGQWVVRRDVRLRKEQRRNRLVLFVAIAWGMGWGLAGLVALFLAGWW